MNAVEIYEKIVEFVDDDGYEDADVVFKEMNRAQKRIADMLFMPDLEEGFDTVDTVVDGREVALPDTYHKGLYLAKVGGVDVAIHKTLADFSIAERGLTLDAGDITGVCARKTSLIYQKIPPAITTIELLYYRLPVPMEEKETSYPDGDVGNDDFEMAIVHDACAYFFNLIEDGIDGAKTNTNKHGESLAERLSMLSAYEEGRGQSFAKRPSMNIGWMGEQ